MCTTCGCAGPATLRDPESGRRRDIGTQAHDHAHDHHHDAHDHARHHGTTLTVEEAVLAKNDRLAGRNRGWLEARGILALNLMSAPGAGKTTLLERTIRTLRAELAIGVVEGDQETAVDAARIRATGAPVVQVNTGAGCHLDAGMIAGALGELAPPPGSLVMIENIGNLICPALFDLGERAKIVVLSVTEGDDKPLKYPHMFRAASLMILSKVDLLPHVDFDAERCLAHARRINPSVECLPLSARTGQGMDAWCAWLRQQFVAVGARDADAMS